MRGEAAAGARSLTVGAVLLTTRPPALRAPPLLALPQSLGRRHRARRPGRHWARRRSGRRRYFRIDGPDCFESRVESRSHTSLPPFPRPREGRGLTAPALPHPRPRGLSSATQPPPNRHPTATQPRFERPVPRAPALLLRSHFLSVPGDGEGQPRPPAGRGPRSRPALPPRSPTARAARPRPARVAPRDTYKLRCFPQVPAENERDTDLAT